MAASAAALRCLVAVLACCSLQARVTIGPHFMVRRWHRRPALSSKKPSPTQLSFQPESTLWLASNLDVHGDACLGLSVFGVASTTLRVIGK